MLLERLPSPQLNLNLTSTQTMNSPIIIDIPPRIIRPVSARPARPATYPTPLGGEDELRTLAQQIVQHDPALALLLARAGQRVRNS